MRWTRVRAGLVVVGGLMGTACGAGSGGADGRPDPHARSTPLPPSSSRRSMDLPADYIG